MTELVIASGKGGTGKTSVVGSLAELAGRTVLVDCDVDAANLHLIIQHKVIERHEFSTSRKATIIPDDCSACGMCEQLCRFDAIRHYVSPDNGRETFVVNQLSCEGCGLCVQICPEKAISFDEVISGEWYRSEATYGPFLHARLGIAQGNSGRLVSLLRREARALADKNGHDLIIVDGPPGIGCPVIAATTGASYLLMVTEPSLAAIHDMQRLHKLADHFAIRTGLCVNKYDINRELTEHIEQFAAENNIRVHARIPFDPHFTDSQLMAQPYIRSATGEGRSAIERLWRNVQEDIERTSAAQPTPPIVTLKKLE